MSIYGYALASVLSHISAGSINPLAKCPDQYTEKSTHATVLKNDKGDLQGFAKVVRDSSDNPKKDKELRLSRKRPRPLPTESIIAGVVSSGSALLVSSAEIAAGSFLANLTRPSAFSLILFILAFNHAGAMGAIMEQAFRFRKNRLLFNL